MDHFVIGEVCQAAQIESEGKAICENVDRGNANQLILVIGCQVDMQILEINFLTYCVGKLKTLFRRSILGFTSLFWLQWKAH